MVSIFMTSLIAVERKLAGMSLSEPTPEEAQSPELVQEEEKANGMV
jgi:hypothetical protein